MTDILRERRSDFRLEDRGFKAVLDAEIYCIAKQLMTVLYRQAKKFVSFLWEAKQSFISDYGGKHEKTKEKSLMQELFGKFTIFLFRLEQNNH